MQPSLRIPAIVVFISLLLAGCNIQVSVLGEGQVQVIENSAAACNDDRPNCLQAAYNSLIQLQAIPAEGYIFTGWAGDCSGTTPTCSLRSLGNRHAIATFKTLKVAVPNMQYIRDFFFSGPWPSDMRLKPDGTLELSDFPLKKGSFASSTRTAAEQHTGFARNGSIFFPLATEFEFTTNRSYAIDIAAKADATFQLINLDQDSAHYLQRIPLRTRLFKGDTLENTSLLQLEPALGHNLEPATTYGVVIFEDTTQNAIFYPIRKGTAMQDIIDNGAQGVLEEHWQRVQAYVSSQTPFQPDQVAAFTLFTTQPETSSYSALSDFLADYDFPAALLATEDQGTVDYFGNCAVNTPTPNTPMIADVHEISVPMPFVLKGNPPFLFSGGELNLAADGALQQTDNASYATLSIAIPCQTPALAQGYPLEIQALGTGLSVADAYSTYRFEYGIMANMSQPTVRIIMPAPYSAGRQYGIEFENINWLSRLIGIDSYLIAIVLGDFNPFNLKSVEPQYLQSALEVLYVKTYFQQLVEAVNADPDQWPQLGWLYGLKIDNSNITLNGNSLGAIGVLHANAIDNSSRNLIIENMPRPNTLHINNLWDAISVYMSGTARNIFTSLLGVRFPIAPQDPFAGLLQTAIDSVDPLNVVSYTMDQNLLLVMEDYRDQLHGQAPSYSIAAGFDVQSPLHAYLLSEEVSDLDYPIEEYVRGPFMRPGDTISAHPVRIVIPHVLSDTPVSTFPGQLARSNSYSYYPDIP